MRTVIVNVVKQNTPSTLRPFHAPSSREVELRVCIDNGNTAPPRRDHSRRAHSRQVVRRRAAWTSTLYFDSPESSREPRRALEGRGLTLNNDADTTRARHSIALANM